MLIIDSRMRDFEKQALLNLGYKLFEIKPDPSLYYEISSHTDIHFCKIKNNLIHNPNIDFPNALCGASQLSRKISL